jgi:VanZ family protein
VLSKKIFFFLAILWTIGVTVLSLASLGSIGSTIKVPYKDKLVHFTFYLMFVLLWSLFFRQSKYNYKILFAAISYGIVMELCQHLFTTKRTADVLDVLANTTGAVVGLLIITTIFNNKTTH